MANHTKEQPFHWSNFHYKSVCPYCDYRSALTSHMKAHIKNIHLKPENFQCMFCPYSSYSPFVLKSHITNNHKEQNLEGTDSDFRTRCKKYVDDLLSQRGLTDLKNSSCDGQINSRCVLNGADSPLSDDAGESYSDDSSEKEEDPLNQDIRQNEQYLSICNAEENPKLEKSDFKDPVVDLNQSSSGPEIMQVSLNPFDYTLPLGFEDPEVKAELAKKRKRKGMETKERCLEKQYPCPQCESCFLKSKHLMFHMKEKHPGVKSFPCTQCDFSTSKSSLLKYHVQAVHKAAAGAIVHQCPNCPYCTTSAEKLLTHIRVKHNRIRPYKCPQCSYSSTQAGHIKIHVRAKHTNEKPYHCSYCGYQSAYSSALKSHITKRHTNN